MQVTQPKHFSGSVSGPWDLSDGSIYMQKSHIINKVCKFDS